MTDPDQQASASDAELGPLVEPVRATPEGAGEPAVVEPRRRFPVLAVGAVAAAAVIGVAIGQTLSRPEPDRPAAVADANAGKSGQGLQISVQTKTVEPAPVPASQVAPMPTPVMEEPAQTVIGPAPRRPSRSAAAPVEPAPEPAAPPPQPSVRRYTSSAPVDPACAYAAADPASGCSDETFIEADRGLYDAYAAARSAGMPARMLRRDQQAWRDQGAEAAARSRSALVEAYRDRTDSVWALIDEWQGEDGGDRRFGRR